MLLARVCVSFSFFKFPSFPSLNRQYRLYTGAGAPVPFYLISSYWRGEWETCISKGDTGATKSHTQRHSRVQKSWRSLPVSGFEHSFPTPQLWGCSNSRGIISGPQTLIYVDSRMELDQKQGGQHEQERSDCWYFRHFFLLFHFNVPLKCGFCISGWKSRLRFVKHHILMYFADLRGRVVWEQWREPSIQELLEFVRRYHNPPGL